MDLDPVPCPACESWDQEVLRRTPQHTTLRCTECGEVHRVTPKALRTIEVGLVVSDEDKSSHHRMELVTTDEVEVGSEFDALGSRMLVTGLETRNGQNVDRSPGLEVRTVFAKRFDTVLVKYTINEGATTRSVTERLDPDARIAIGLKRTVAGEKVIVKTIKDDANMTVRRGDVPARHIKRVFCDPARERKRRPGVQWGPPSR